MHFADPKSNVLQLGLHDGMVVADLGSGSGHYAVAAAAAVGRSGRVYAVDIQEDLLKHVLDAAHQAGIRNIETIWGNIEHAGGTKIRDGMIDAVLLSNTLFQVEHKENLIKEITRILKPGGKLLLIDWSGAYGGLGPDPEHVVSERDAEGLFIGHGFYKAKEFRAGAHHYAIVFTTPDR